MDMGVSYYFIEYIFLSIEENKDIWCEAYDLPVGGENMARRPLELVFFAYLCNLFRAFLLFIQRKELRDED